MAEPEKATPWAFVAHKDGKWAGVAAADMPKKDLGKFICDFAADGFSIMPVASRDEWLEVSGRMPMWKHGA